MAPKQVLIDSTTTASAVYIGKAELNIGVSEDRWQIIKISYSAVTDILYPQGRPGFQHKWEDRASLVFGVSGA